MYQLWFEYPGRPVGHLVFPLLRPIGSCLDLFLAWPQKANLGIEQGHQEGLLGTFESFSESKIDC